MRIREIDIIIDFSNKERTLSGFTDGDAMTCERGVAYSVLCLSTEWVFII